MILGPIDARHRLVEDLRIVAVSSRQRLASMAMIVLVPFACAKSGGWLTDRSMAITITASAAAMSDQSISSPPVTTDTSDLHDVSVVWRAAAADQPTALADRNPSVQFGPSGPMLNELIDTFRLFLPHIPFDISAAVKPALSGPLTSVAVQDHVAYLQFGGAAMAVIEVSEPSQLREVGRLSLAACPGETGRVVATSARVAVLCTTHELAERSDRGESALLAFRSESETILEPESTTFVHDIAFDVALSDAMAQLTTVNFGPTGYRLNLSAIDLSQPRSGRPAGDLDIGLVGLHLAMAGQSGVVFGYDLAGNALQFLDLTVPTSPHLAGRLKLPEIDPQKPWQRLSSLAMWDSVAYGFQSDGLTVVDARDVDHPVAAAFKDHDFGDCNGFLAVSTERLVVLTRGCRNGADALYVFDHWTPLDQPGSGVGPTLLGTLPLQTQGLLGEYDHPMAVEGHHIFIIDESGWDSGRPRSLLVIDAVEPAAPRLLGRMAFPW